MTGQTHTHSTIQFNGIIMGRACERENVMWPCNECNGSRCHRHRGKSNTSNTIAEGTEKKMKNKRAKNTTFAALEHERSSNLINSNITIKYSNKSAGKRVIKLLIAQAVYITHSLLHTLTLARLIAKRCNVKMGTDTKYISEILRVRISFIIHDSSMSSIKKAANILFFSHSVRNLPVYFSIDELLCVCFIFLSSFFCLFTIGQLYTFCTFNRRQSTAILAFICSSLL